MCTGCGNTGTPYQFEFGEFQGQHEEQSETEGYYTSLGSVYYEINLRCYWGPCWGPF